MNHSDTTTFLCFGTIHASKPLRLVILCHFNLHQGMYFNRIAATKGEKDDFAIARFGNEAERCLKMLEAWTWKPLTLELKTCVVTPHV